MNNRYKTAVRLEPVDIPKPWGKEVWFTGMEARGESRVVLPDGEREALSDYLRGNPTAACASVSVLLLKVLDPDPTPVKGDLYFEVHEEKREVYIVTAINKQAKGGIRFGMNQSKRASFEDDNAFRAAYLQAVRDYEAVRRQIDEQGKDLQAQEQRLRAEMETFTALRQLKVGDVVSVPTWTPHALQHGVRVVEFQTQTYERFIVSFAQAVVTQDHWDTEHAVANMHLDAPRETTFEPVASGVERIARFEDFNVWRAGESAGAISLPSTLPYAVCMAVGGRCSVGELTLTSEQACFVPHDALPHTRCQALDIGAHCLIAAPGL